ncbi:MAG: histidine phosphatase family protein [Clostridia bacterium]|nr:histidine phosphatase family protein [Clostridia bacterium]
MEILLTRHGQTEWNVLGKVQGKADIELNKKGIEQAEETARALESEKIDLIICSPLKRAKQTADIINENRNIPIIYDENISERDFGEFEGINKVDFDFEGYWSYKQNNKYKKAENIKTFFERVYNFLDRIKYEYEDKRILIVAHGGISIPVYCYFNGIPKDDNLLKLLLENCEIAKYEYK